MTYLDLALTLKAIAFRAGAANATDPMERHRLEFRAAIAESMRARPQGVAPCLATIFGGR